MSERAARLRAYVAAATLLSCGAAGPIARAEMQPPPGQCPEKIGCTEVHAKIAAHRRQLRQLKARLENKQNRDPVDDEATIERHVTDLSNLAQCSRCSNKLRSEAYAIQSGIEGLLAEHYDGWGMKRGEDGRRIRWPFI